MTVRDLGAPSGRGRSVLVVDDDEAIRETLREVLSDEGYLVEVAENGARALERMRAPLRPGLVLLDLMMPVMSGCGADGTRTRGLRRDRPAL